MPVKIVLIAAAFLSAAPAQAHVESAGDALRPAMLGGLLLVILWLAYCIGAGRVRPGSGRRLAFHGAGLIAALSLFVPPDGAALHMIEHMLILVVIAPLWVLARPLPQWLAASGRAGVRLWKPVLRLGRYPLRMAGLQALAIWFWHTPKFYNLALASPWWHLAEHICFALVAGLFWWAVLGRRTAAALPALLFTFMHTGLLGALLTFAQTPWYGDSHDLQDQQLAGLIMWVPGGLPYLIACVWCALRWLMAAANPGATTRHRAP